MQSTYPSLWRGGASLQLVINVHAHAKYSQTLSSRGERFTLIIKAISHQPHWRFRRVFPFNHFTRKIAERK